MTQKLKIGDVFEIPCPNGYAYAQFTHIDPLMGELIQLPRRLFRVPQESLPDISSSGIYAVFCPLGPLYKRRAIRKIAHQNILPEFSKFPRFRSGVFAPESGAIQVQKIWDGVNLVPAGNDEDLGSLPQKEAISLSVLIKRVSEFPIE